MSQKIDIRERRFNGADYDTLHPETNINMVLDSSNNSVGEVKGALYGDGNGNIVGATISNPNLLDNPWFTINQRGITTTSTNEAFISDRWQIYRGTGVVNADKTITFTAAQAGAAIYQISPYRSDIVGKVVTLSIMFNDGSVESGTVTAVASESRVVTLPSGISLYLDTRNDREQFTINVPNGTTVTLRAVKLELGSISTLANDVAPNYTTELLKCQRYFYRIVTSTSVQALLPLDPVTATDLRATLYLPVAMRATPTISYTGTLNVHRPNDSSAPIQQINLLTLGSSYNNLALQIIPSTSVSVGENCFLRNSGIVTISISADL